MFIVTMIRVVKKMVSHNDGNCWTLPGFFFNLICWQQQGIKNYIDESKTVLYFV